MHLISKFTDYYDYLVGYYGYDRNIVYDRRSEKKVILRPEAMKSNYGWSTLHYLFSICGVYYPVIYVCKGGEFIVDEKDKRLNHYDKHFLRHNTGKPSKVNVEHRQPVILEIHGNTLIPKLSEYGFASRIDAHEMYQKIYAFLGWLKDNPVEPNTQTDKDKVVSHGFDLKRSFRPNIKK